MPGRIGPESPQRGSFGDEADQLRQVLADAEELLRKTSSTSSDTAHSRSERLQSATEAALSWLESLLRSSGDPAGPGADHATRLARQTMEAIALAEKSRLRSYEWLSLGLFLCLGYTLLVVLPRAELTLFDAFTLLLSLGMGIAMFCYERASANGYLRIGETLGKTYDHFYQSPNGNAQLHAQPQSRPIGSPGTVASSIDSPT
ncbi:hypothetical protein [Steroidobacter cummioxidans]|uniref:hypothetical protein n=1 Tax=Steroidobacter cummioxidans TaxID=1803913 RepID=UPI00128FFDE7|nr:hypothetical protein [Steroidobacter cummioxidans]